MNMIGKMYFSSKIVAADIPSIEFLSVISIKIKSGQFFSTLAMALSPVAAVPVLSKPLFLSRTPKYMAFIASSSTISIFFLSSILLYSVYVNCLLEF